MDHIEIENFLSRIPSLQVLVVGDLMLDEYIWGKTERISPEAPVPVVDVVCEESRLGGAGNVANNLVSLGARVQIASVLGDDAVGNRLRHLLAEMEIDLSGVVLAEGRMTICKSRVIASNQQIVRVDRECRSPVSAVQEAQLIEFVSSAAANCQVILVSDYLKGVLTEKLLAAIFASGRKFGIPVVVDPKGGDFRKYRGASVLTPNRKEAQSASGIAIVDFESLRRAGFALCEQIDLDALVITRSDEGMSLFFRDGSEIHLSTEAQEVFDVSGAGDTVLSLIGLGLGFGLPLEIAARLSNLAAGVVVGKVGTSAVTPEELLNVVRKGYASSEFKIKSRELLQRLLDDKRMLGERIVFTNGCFDLLHVGHIKYLHAAKKLGDILVLGLNTDASVRRLKGPKRPVMTQDERAHILAALDCVDYVVLFDEDTPLELITALRPHILVKGGDYSLADVVGREVVESYGGSVELIEFVPSQSTTSVIEKVLLAYKD